MLVLPVQAHISGLLTLRVDYSKTMTVLGHMDLSYLSLVGRLLPAHMSTLCQFESHNLEGNPLTEDVCPHTNDGYSLIDDFLVVEYSSLQALEVLEAPFVGLQVDSIAHILCP